MAQGLKVKMRDMRSGFTLTATPDHDHELSDFMVMN
jgi:hypothetical protein